jgi:hypothetical protein
MFNTSQPLVFSKVKGGKRTSTERRKKTLTNHLYSQFLPNPKFLVNVIGGVDLSHAVSYRRFKLGLIVA